MINFRRILGGIVLVVVALLLGLTVIRINRSGSSIPAPSSPLSGHVLAVVPVQADHEWKVTLSFSNSAARAITIRMWNASFWHRLDSPIPQASDLIPGAPNGPTVVLDSLVSTSFTFTAKSPLPLPQPIAWKFSAQWCEVPNKKDKVFRWISQNIPLVGGALRVPQFTAANAELDYPEGVFDKGFTEQVGPANRSQSVTAQTNRTSVAAGSGR